MNRSVFDPERLSKISNINASFFNVARVGDEVHMGLQGDPAFPYSDDARPMATIQDVKNVGDNVQIQLGMPDGTTKTVDQYTISPGDVWEFTDASFEKVLHREQQAHMSRAEAALKAAPVDEKYRGVESLSSEIDQLRAELNAERELVKSFHNTYIASMSELATDICKLDTNNEANFCRTFKKEYDTMMHRAEGKFRGTASQAEEEDSMSEDDTSLVSDYF